MKQLYPDLWQSRMHRGGMVNSYAYLLTRPSGNVLFYNTGDSQDLADIEQLGGIKYQLLTHRDEAGPSLERIKERFGNALMFSKPEAAAIAKHSVATSHFAEGDSAIEDIAVIETPGHTDGSVCFLYHSPFGKQYLFTGDTLFMWKAQWKTFVLRNSGGTDSALRNSLNKLKQLSPDVVLSSGFIGEIGVSEITDGQWQEILAKQIAELAID